MINCQSCVKNDVCKYKINLTYKLISLEVSKAVQALTPFKINVSCIYFQAPKILRGENDE